MPLQLSCRRTFLSHHISDQPLTSSLVLSGHHHALSHQTVLHKRLLDLSQLDPVSTHLHLIVRSPDELYVPITQIPPNISRPIQPLSLPLAESVRNELLSRQLRPPHISSRQSLSGYVYLSFHSYRRRLQRFVQHIHLRVRYRPPDRRRFTSCLSLFYFIHATSHHRLRRTIFIDQPRPFRTLLPILQYSPPQLLSSYHQHSRSSLHLSFSQLLSQHFQVRRCDLHQTVASLLSQLPTQRLYPLRLRQQFHSPPAHQRAVQTRH